MADWDHDGRLCSSHPCDSPRRGWRENPLPADFSVDAAVGIAAPARAIRARITRRPFLGTADRRGDFTACKSHHTDPPADVMPDYENQNQERVW